MLAASLENVKKTYPQGELKVEALKGVSLNIRKGDLVSVAGPSGSGKTTLMNILGLLDRLSSGEVFIEGRRVNDLSRGEVTRLRHRSLGFVFQSFNLIPVLNVVENVELPLVMGSFNRRVLKRERGWVDHLLEEVGLQERRHHRPGELSGGQQQRVAIARALVCRPSIVIADEPTANLDSATGEKILNLMQLVNREERTTFIFSTHDSNIWGIANHRIFLKDGLIESESHL